MTESRLPAANTGLTYGARLALLLILAVYGVISLSNPDTFRLLDNVDLAIHETGHLVFAPFGEFMGFLGGTLMQLLVPTAFWVHFRRRGEKYAASVILWWVAQNCWNISVYVKDARSQLLPLVGGGEHDWAYLLGRLDMLHLDQGLARAVHLAGVIIFGLSLWWGFFNAGTGAGPTAAEAQDTGAVESPPDGTTRFTEREGES